MYLTNNSVNKTHYLEKTMSFVLNSKHLFTFIHPLINFYTNKTVSIKKIFLLKMSNVSSHKKMMFSLSKKNCFCFLEFIHFKFSALITAFLITQLHLTNTMSHVNTLFHSQMFLTQFIMMFLLSSSKTDYLKFLSSTLLS